jgi:periplasmic copper chaperone A
VSLPRPLARLAVLATALLAALAGSVVVAGSASAHVTVSTEDAAPGGYGKIVFRVPNESDTASTVSLRIQVPEDAAMTSFSTQPVAGWTVIRTTTDLAEPLTVQGAQITSYVSVIEFRAEAGAGIAPGQFQEFALSGGPFPEVDALSFPTVQVYSDGSESAWIEPSVEGQEEPESPAPVLTLATGGTGDATTAGRDGGAAHDAGAESGPSGLALFLSILALLAAIGAAVLGFRANRRTVSS